MIRQQDCKWENNDQGIEWKGVSNVEEVGFIQKKKFSGSRKLTKMYNKRRWKRTREHREREKEKGVRGRIAAALDCDTRLSLVCFGLEINPRERCYSHLFGSRVTKGSRLSGIIVECGSQGKLLRFHELVAYVKRHSLFWVFLHNILIGDCHLLNFWLKMKGFHINGLIYILYKFLRKTCSTMSKKLVTWKCE